MVLNPFFSEMVLYKIKSCKVICIWLSHYYNFTHSFLHEKVERTLNMDFHLIQFGVCLRSIESPLSDLGLLMEKFAWGGYTPRVILAFDSSGQRIPDAVKSGHFPLLWNNIFFVISICPSTFS